MIKIGDNNVGEGQPTFIIAEAGVNHNGNIEIAKKLIDIAVDAGVDAVKFQTFNADDLVTKNAPKADYQYVTTGQSESQYNMLKKLELSKKDHKVLINYCKKMDLLFMSTPFDFKSVDLLEELGIEIYKVSSGDLTNIPLLKYIARLDKPMIVSTGMANIGEVEEAVNAIQEMNNEKIVLLHCVSNYPAEYEDINLRAINTLNRAFNLPTGYSDHAIGLEVPIAAVAMGARVIEKHFTLNKDLDGPDHRASLNPLELKKMVRSIRIIEKSFGDGVKKCTENEKPNKYIARKSIIATKNIRIGESFNSSNISIKRPEDGIKPNRYSQLVKNGKASKNICKNQAIKRSMISFE